MAIEVAAKDCTALSDAELEEMADLVGDEPVNFDIGVLSKERDSWVLVTHARTDGTSLQGFAFCTLERIGGTPSVLVGLGAVKATSRRDTVLRALIGDMMRRAVLAFPDEDVLVGFRFGRPDAMEVLASLQDIRPSTTERASGEDRAWGRRLVKRYGLEGSYDDRAFQLAGTGTRVPVFDHESLKPEELGELAPLFEGIDVAAGDCVVGFGWAMAEDLAKLAG